MQLSLTPAAYRKWELYWLEEPWGPWRDNLHAAIIARAGLTPWQRNGAPPIDMDQFMIRRREEDGAGRVTSFINALYRMSKPGDKPRKE